MLQETIGFVGAGQMARALARGMVQATLVESSRIVAYDPVAEAGAAFCGELPGARVLDSNPSVVEAADVIVLAVKPQSLPSVSSQLEPVETDGKLFVSILAGVPLATLCEELSTTRVIRVMPNTPCLVGQGAAGYALGAGASADDGRLVGQLLSAVGVAFELDEKLLDAVTGLSGSGPAYVFTIIEALSDGGVRAGLPRPTASALAVQTVLGAAQLVASTSDHPAVLRERVTSPGGTTSLGLQVLESKAVRSALIDAVQAATERSRELGRSS